MKTPPHGPHHHGPIHAEHESPEQAAMRWLAQLQANLADSVNGITLRGALPVPIGGPVGGPSQATNRPLSNGAGRLVGYSIREASLTSPILVRLYDGPDASGRLLDTIPLASGVNASADSKARAWYGPGGLSITNGLFVQLTALDGVSNPAGAVEGDVFLGSAD